MSYCTDVTDISTLSKRQDLLFAVLASLEYTKTKADIKLIARLLGETYDAVQYRLRTPKNVASAMVSQLREGRGQSQPRPAPKKIKKTGTSGARGSRRGPGKVKSNQHGTYDQPQPSDSVLDVFDNDFALTVDPFVVGWDLKQIHFP